MRWRGSVILRTATKAPGLRQPSFTINTSPRHRAPARHWRAQKVRKGFKIFDADAHVIYPPNLWQNYLDKKYVDRVGSKQPVPGFETYNPVTVDGTWTQSDTTLYGQFQKYINWTKDDMIAQYGEELVLEGFTGDRVARALSV